MQRIWPLTIACAVAALTSCENPANNKLAPKTSAKTATQASKAPTLTQGNQTAAREIRGMVRLTTEDGVKLVGNDAASFETGRLISNNSGGLISNNGGGLISNNSGGLISNNGGGLISNNSGGLVSSNGGTFATVFGLLQASTTAAPEDRLAEAVIEVIDAAGNVLTDQAGKPIRTTSDQQGNYVLQANLSQQNFLLRVKLNEKLAPAGSELRAMVAGGSKAGAVEVPIDSNSSLAAGYVLSEYVKGRNEVFARLPDDANMELRRDVGTARALLGQTALSYDPEKLRQTVGDLRKQSSALDQTLEKVKAILLVGQAELGQGELATQVPLSLPIAVARDGQGNTYIAEEVAGRVRRVNADGRVELFAGDRPAKGYREGITRDEMAFGSVSDIALHPKGGLLVCDEAARAVYHIESSGTVKRLVSPEFNPEFIPRVLAVGAKGEIYLSGQSHLYQLDGPTIKEIAPTTLTKKLVTGLTVANDGALWVVKGGGELLRLAPGESQWMLISKDLQAGTYGRMAPVGPRDVYVSESVGDRLVRVSPDGKAALVFGQGQPGQKVEESTRSVTLGAMQFRRPSGLAVLPDGQILVADYWQQLVRRVDPGNPSAGLARFAGLDGPAKIAGREVVAVSNPVGLAARPDGDGFVYAEAGSHVVRQYRGGQVSLVAGGNQWTIGAGTRGADAALTSPSGVRYDRAGNLWVLEGAQPRLLKITKEGVISVMAGNGKSLPTEKVPDFNPGAEPATAVQLGRPVSLAIGPDDQPYWSDQAYNVVCKLTKQGTIEVVAGTVPAKVDAGGDAGDGGPATKALMRYPLSIAFDKSGDLYIADTGNFRVRKVTLSAPAKTMSTFMGLGSVQTLLAVTGMGASAVKAEEAVADAATILPVSLFVDEQNALYIADLGTTRSAPVARGYGVNLPPDFPSIPSRVRRVALGSPPLTLKTVAGPGGRALVNEFGDESLGLPVGILIDGKGQLVVSDTLNNQIKLVPGVVTP